MVSFYFSSGAKTKIFSISLVWSCLHLFEWNLVFDVEFVVDFFFLVFWDVTHVNDLYVFHTPNPMDYISLSY